MNKDLAKIKLIYEFNPGSSLFARVAEAELIDGNLDKAMQILEKGLKKYPDYIAAHLVYIEVLAKKGEYKKVIDKLEEIRPLVNDDATINYYLEKIEEEKSSSQNTDEEVENLKKPFEDNLENLAETISKAKIPPVDNAQPAKQNRFTSPSGTQFVSETLADIYLSQGNFKEALDIYEKLNEINPAKRDQYAEKIQEIKNLMNK